MANRRTVPEPAGRPFRRIVAPNLLETIAHLPALGALAVASHSRVFESDWGMHTLYLRIIRDLFAPLLDTSEIANCKPSLTYATVRSDRL
jgi:hypothetical protein